MSEIKRVHDDGLKLEGEMTRRELMNRLSPLGKVATDSSKCTGCGLCALECPTGALALSANGEILAFQLLFKHGKCLACNRCVEICPEKCLSMERTLEPEIINSQAVFFEDTIARCPECGSPIGPRAMLDKVRRVVTGKQALSSRPELCPACKIKAQFASMRV